LQDTGNNIMQGNAYHPMQSTHNASAIMQARQKPVVDQFSDKALVDYKPYQSVDSFGQSNPVMLRQAKQSGAANFDNRPKRLMPNFPTRQGQHFSLNLGQNVRLTLLF
jgi:hypothetical protein